ncbi:MAG: AmmeMemoRadiSam system radical SAM enzyme [Coriobacteriia bacterium]|nr:AmmeMemoRadiSam system radical SAM enzyme [Coriobacteriia bacterium]
MPSAVSPAPAVDPTVPDPAPGSTPVATCGTCPHGCRLPDGHRGRCQARIARDGAVVAEAYGRTTGLALDPIEKKPFARFMPGTFVLSTGGYGCNMNCPWCQNDHISTAGPADVRWRSVTPDQLVAQALDLRDRGCAGLAFTFNEPLITWEFVRDAALLARRHDLITTLVSNGMATDAVLDELLPVIDAANIDLKTFDPAAYQRAGGHLPTVMNTIQRMAAQPGLHLEVTWLAVPGVSTDENQLRQATAWLVDLDPSIPLHVTRFFPCHRMRHVPPTDLGQLFHLVDVAREHLTTVIPGNV